MPSQGINVEEEDKDQSSVLSFYRRLLDLRHNSYSDALIHGHFELLDPNNEGSMVFTKQSTSGQKLWIALNFSGEQQVVDIPSGMQLILGTMSAEAAEGKLEPWEGRMYLQK